MKQLEQALRDAVSPEILPDVTTLLPIEPQQMNESKYELVIEQILEAYQEHPLLRVNFFADLKQKEETYLVRLFLFIIMGFSV